MVSRGGGVVGLVLGVDSGSFIGDFSNISIISISGISNMLGTTIGKSNRVRTNSISVTSTGLSSVEGSLGVVISYGIFKSVGLSWAIIGSRGRGMVGRGRLVVSWGVDHGGMHYRGMVSRSVVNNGGSMVSGGMVDNRGSMVGRGMVDNGGGMVDSVVSRGMGRVVSTNIGRGVRGGDSSGGNHSSGVFLRVVVGMDSLWSSMGLASHCSCIGTMGLVD